MAIPILSDIFGSKPQVPNFIPTDPLAELTTLLGGEIKDWGQIENLSNLYETYMTGAMTKLIPNFTDILKQGGIDTGALETQALPEIEGQIPSDVAGQVFRDAAFSSLGAGTLGSPMGTALTPRDLGITSLDLQTQGANLLGQAGNAAQRWNQIAQGLILPPSASMYSPQWFSEFEAQQRAQKWQVQMQKNIVSASPNPIAKGISDLVAYLTASYIGHGPAGQPPQGTNYNQMLGTSASQAGQTPANWQSSVGSLLGTQSAPASTPDASASALPFSSAYDPSFQSPGLPTASPNAITDMWNAPIPTSNVMGGSTFNSPMIGNPNYPYQPTLPPYLTGIT
jgi:hypothetical protein